MTFRVERSSLVNTQVILHITSGPVEISITEDYRYLGVFLRELGDILRVVENEQNAEVEQFALLAGEWEGLPSGPDFDDEEGYLDDDDWLPDDEY